MTLNIGKFYASFVLFIDILRLLNDMHVGMDKIADYISPSAVENSSKQNACWANPATLYNAIKHCFREEFVGTVILIYNCVLLCIV